MKLISNVHVVFISLLRYLKEFILFTFYQLQLLIHLVKLDLHLHDQVIVRDIDVLQLLVNFLEPTDVVVDCIFESEGYPSVRLLFFQFCP